MATPSDDLQKAVRDALLADAAVSAIVGQRVYDDAPSNATFPYLAFGPSDGDFDRMDGVSLTIETLQIDGYFRDGRRLRPAKAMAGLIKAALDVQPLLLETHALALLRVVGARSFRDSDNVTARMVVTIEAEIEERDGS